MEPFRVMELRTRQMTPEIAVIELSGRLMLGPDCARIDKEIEELIGKNQKRVILDCSELRLIDSAGVGQVVKSFSRLKKSGGELRLAGVKGMLDGVFKMTQVHKVIGMYPTAREASENF